AELEIRDALMRYACLFDANDIDGFMEAFHSDAVVVNWRGTFERDAIRRDFLRGMRAREFGFHYLTNITVRLVDDETAWACSYFHAIQINDSKALEGIGGTYVDRLTRRDGNWRISERRQTRNFR